MAVVAETAANGDEETERDKNERGNPDVELWRVSEPHDCFHRGLLSTIR